MLDLEAIQTRLSRLDEYVRILRELRTINREEFVSDYRAYGLAERYLHLSIECLLDVCNMIVSGLGLRKPARYQEVVEILAEGDVLSESLARRLAGVAGFRNILVHEYLNVDRDLVYDYLHEGLAHLEAFASEVIQFLRGQQQSGAGDAGRAL